MALAVNTEMTTSTGISVTTGTTVSFAFNNVAGTYLLGLSTACIAGNNPAFTAATTTYAGAALTEIGTIKNTNNTAWIGEKVTPATGSNTMTFTISPDVGTAANGTAIGGVATFTGQHATTPHGTVSTSSGSTAVAGASITGTLATSICILVCNGGSDFTSNSNTLSWAKNVNGLSSGNNARCNRAAGTGGTVTLTDTMSGSDSWVAAAVEVFAAAAAGSASSYVIKGPLLAFRRGTLISQ